MAQLVDQRAEKCRPRRFVRRNGSLWINENASWLYEERLSSTSVVDEVINCRVRRSSAGSKFLLLLSRLSPPHCAVVAELSAEQDTIKQIQGRLQYSGRL